jgi:transposase
MVNSWRLSRRPQVVELPQIKPLVTEYRLHAGRCERCGKYHETALPAGVRARLTGPRLLALMGTLTGGYRLSKRQVQGLLQDVFNIEVSVGTISQSEESLSAMLAPTVEQAHAYVRQSAVVHADETGHHEKGIGQWMWIAIAGLVSVFMARPSRSADMARELLGAAFAGILVSDRYAAYGWMPAHRRQVCWAHLLRDFTKITERTGDAGRIGKALLDNAHRMFDFWHRVRDGTMSRDAFASHMQFLRAQIEAGLREGSACGESRTENTCEQILKVREALWTFVHNPDVEPTNNLAERTLRSYVIWRKTCFGTQSRRGSRYMERVMTVVGCCKLQGHNILDFITQTVRACWGDGTAPSLIPS